MLHEDNTNTLLLLLYPLIKVMYEYNIVMNAKLARILNIESMQLILFHIENL